MTDNVRELPPISRWLKHTSPDPHPDHDGPLWEDEFLVNYADFDAFEAMSALGATREEFEASWTSKSKLRERELTKLGVVLTASSLEEAWEKIEALDSDADYVARRDPDTGTIEIRAMPRVVKSRTHEQEEVNDAEARD